MISPAEILTKLTRLYPTFLQAVLLEDLHFFPLEFSVGKLPMLDYDALRTAVASLRDTAKPKVGYGYTLAETTIQTRNFGAQTIPQRLIIETERDYVKLIKKEREVSRFRDNIALIRQQLPALAGWLLDNPLRVVDADGRWPELLRVCAYFLSHPRPNLYLRELPIDVHTKFIENHEGMLRHLLDYLLPDAAKDLSSTTFEQRFGLRYDEPTVRLRMLDGRWQAEYSGLPIDDLEVPVSQLQRLNLSWAETIIVVENKMNFLTLPPLPRSIAIWGRGFSVNVLRSVPWLQRCKLLYWGDIDAHGFQILALFRTQYPQTQALMMDRATMETFQAYCVASTPTKISQLAGLTPTEQALYDYLVANNLRLEQEHIAQAYVQAALREALSLL